MKKHLRILYPLLPALAAGAVALLLRAFPAVSEWLFARGAFAFCSLLGRAVQYIPFSLTEGLVIAALPLCLALGIWLICRRKKMHWRRLLRGVAWTLSCLFLWYMLMHGFQYSRVPLAEQMALPEGQATVAELAALAEYAAKEASAARELCEEDEAGVMRLTAPLADTLQAGGAGYEALGRQYPFLGDGVTRAKGVRHSHLWSYTGITGVYFPLFGEANVNVDIPDSELPVTLAHELAHARGWAHEDECNLLGILACISHPDAEWRYAGYLAMYIHASNSLYQNSPALWREIAGAYLSDGVRRDLAARSAYWAAFEGTVQQVSTSVNNAFIEANGDAEGVTRYGEVTRLLIMWRRTAE